MATGNINLNAFAREAWQGRTHPGHGNTGETGELRCPRRRRDFRARCGATGWTASTSSRDDAWFDVLRRELNVEIDGERNILQVGAAAQFWP